MLHAQCNGRIVTMHLIFFEIEDATWDLSMQTSHRILLYNIITTNERTTINLTSYSLKEYDICKYYRKIWFKL